MRIGVIGIGAMGKNHVRVYSEIDDVELVGVSDIDEKNGKAIARKFNCEYFPDYTNLLEKVDAVTIAVPTSQHSEIGKAAIERGVHILMEKPLAKTIEQSKELVELSRKKGIVLAVGHIERHNPVVRHLKKLLEENTFGKIFNMTSRRVSNYPKRIRDVGVIMDLAVHDIDICRYLAGTDVDMVFSVAGASGHTRFEDHATIMLKFKNDILGIVDTNWLTPMRVRGLSVTCERSFIQVDYMAQSLQISTSKLGELDETNLFKLPLEMETVSVGLKKEEPLKKEIEDFIGAIEQNRSPLVTGEDGIMIIRLAEAAMCSAREGKAITIEDD